MLQAPARPGPVFLASRGCCPSASLRSPPASGLLASPCPSSGSAPRQHSRERRSLARCGWLLLRVSGWGLLGGALRPALADPWGCRRLGCGFCFCWACGFPPLRAGRHRTAQSSRRWGWYGGLGVPARSGDFWIRPPSVNRKRVARNSATSATAWRRSRWTDSEFRAAVTCRNVGRAVCRCGRMPAGGAPQAAQRTKSSRFSPTFPP